VECLQEAHNEVHKESSLDLKQWTDSWLKTKGPNEISASFAAGKLTIN
jgi:hypothetical protein